jgi:hypothetical protein
MIAPSTYRKYTYFLSSKTATSTSGHDAFSQFLLRNIRFDAEGKLDEASLRLVAQLSISHEKLGTIEDEMDKSSLTPNLFTSSREILCSCVACSCLLSRDYVVAQRMQTEQITTTSQCSRAPAASGIIFHLQGYVFNGQIFPGQGFPGSKRMLG